MEFVGLVLATSVARRGISPRIAPRDSWSAFIANRLAIGRPSVRNYIRDQHRDPHRLLGLQRFGQRRPRYQSLVGELSS